MHSALLQRLTAAFPAKSRGGRLRNPLVTDGVRHAGLGALALGEFIVGNENARRGNAASWTLALVFFVAASVATELIARFHVLWHFFLIVQLCCLESVRSTW